MTYTETRTHAFPETGFRIGRVISKAFEVFFRNFITFTAIASVVWLPFFVLSMLAAQGQAGAAAGDAVAVGLLSYVVILILSPLATAIILHGAFQSMRGRQVRVWESVSTTVSRILPLLAVILLSMLGIVLGTFLLFVPGVILMLMWYVAVPACIVERAGPIRSLGRSRELTKGHRWQILAIVLVIALLSGIGGALTGALGALGNEWLGLVSQLLWQGVSGGFGGVLGAVVYYHLRVAKEGVDVEQIAAVFD